MESAKHIIRKKKFNLVHHGSTDVFALQQASEHFCKERLLPAIEKLFDSKEDGNTVYLNKVKLHADVTSVNELNDWLVADIISQFEKEILKAKQESRDQSASSIGRDAFSALLSYLQSGTIPAYITEPVWQWQRKLLNALENLSVERKRLLRNVLGKRPAMERLAASKNEDLFWMVLHTTTPGGEKVEAARQVLQKWVSLLQSISVNDVQARFKIFLVKAVLIGKEPLSSDEDIFSTTVVPAASDLTQEQKQSMLEKFEALMESIDTEGVAEFDTEQDKDAVVKKQTNGEDDQELQTDTILTINAGIVLLYPFISRFFANIGLEPMKNVDEKHRAVGLLHYIVTGQQIFEQYEVVLPKILMDVPLKDIVAPVELITDKEKEETKNVLRAVIDNWKVLKNTSVDGLRQSFLQRSGALRKKDSGWHLSIQPEAYDMLLDHLPWSISMIKLPWMKELLTVEWDRRSK